MCCRDEVSFVVTGESEPSGGSFHVGGEVIDGSAFYENGSVVGGEGDF